MTTEILQLVSGAIGSVGFALIFNMRGKYLPTAAFGGALGWFVYLTACTMTSGIFRPMLAAGFAVAIYAEIMARLCRAPSTPFFVTSVIPLIPGSSLFYCMNAAVEGDMASAADYGFETFLFSLAIAAGMGIAWCLCDLYRKLRDRLKIRKRHME